MLTLSKLCVATASFELHTKCWMWSTCELSLRSWCVLSDVWDVFLHNVVG